MNRIYRLIWNRNLFMFVPVSEHGTSVQTASARSGRRTSLRLVMAMTTAMTMNLADLAEANPVGGQVTSGSGSISQSGNTTTIAQHSRNLSLNWQGFNVAPQETVNFVQPNSQAIAVNRILSNQGSQILGHLNANGQVWLINPNGILFGAGAQVNVGALVASTLAIPDSELGAQTRHFAGNGSGSVINQGNINAAPGGYVALLGQQVSNQGSINAPGGMVALGAGTQQTLTFADDQLLQLQVEQSTLNTLADNSGLIQADGGRVILSAGAKDAVLASVVNNTGVIEAQTVGGSAGTITLLGGMEAGAVSVGGVLDASAPHGGNGGAIDTSAAQVKLAPGAQVTTAAAQGQAGNWLIDPQNYTIASSGGDITGAQVSGLLANNNIAIVSDQGATAGSGDINVNDAISWSSVNTLTLNAVRNINFNTGGNVTATAGSLTAHADINGSGVGTVQMNGGRINVSGGGNILFYYNPAVFGTPSTFSNVTLSGSGSATNYMLVNTPAALQNVSVNPAGNYALGKNIDASSIVNFIPISTYSGKFNGLNYTISNLTESYAGVSDIGLFKQLSSSATVANLNLANVNINGADHVGALVGYDNGAKINNVGAAGTVTAINGYVGGLIGAADNGSSISYASSSATVSEPAGSTGLYIGGLIGNMTASGTATTLTNSFATGLVSPPAGVTYVGGLVGAMTNVAASISNSYATGMVNGVSDADVGGLVGIGSTINASYATGAVVGKSLVGGFLGALGSGGSVNTSYSTGSVSGATDVGGFVGDIVSANNPTVSNSYATGNVSLTPGASTGNAIGGFAGLNSSSISNSYAAGSVVGVSGAVHAGNVGGFLGATLGSSASISHSFWDVTTSGQTTSAGTGAVGMVTAAMQTQANYTSSTTANNNSSPAWDFTNTWKMGTGSYLYPVFQAVVGVKPLASAMQSYYPLTLTQLTASNKVYDAGVTASSTATLAGLLSGDAVNLVLSSSQFSNKNVGTGKTVTLNGATLSGAAAGKYQLVPAAGMTTTANITPLAITVTATGADKVYDATVNEIATVASNGVLNGDTVSFSDTAATFSDKNVGTGKTVTVTGISASGTDAGNYSVNASATTSANITPLAITVAATGTNKVYDATLNDAATLASSGVLSGDSVSFNDTSASFADKNVGTSKTVIVSGIGASGTDAGNYTLSNTSATTSANITTLTIAVVATAANKVYDATVNDSATVASNGVLAGDTVSFSDSAAAFSDKNVGTGKTVTVTGISANGADAANYAINPSATTTANITPLAITVAATGTNKVYDATLNDAATLASSGVLTGDSVSFGQTAASFADKNAGTGKTVTVSGISASGADAANYTINTSATTTASITPLAITVAATGANKVYDATLNDAATLASSGVLSGDSVSFNDTAASFADKNVGTGKTVSVSGISVNGTDAGNYTLNNSSAITTANITPLAITVAATGANKVYDATVNDAAMLASSGVLSGDSVSFNDTAASFADKNVGTGKTVSVSGISASGTDAGNYTLNNNSATTSANITPLAISVAATGGTQIYNGTVNAQVGLASSGVLAGDSVAFTDAGASFANKNVGTGKTVTVSGIGASGSDAGNYTLSNTSATTTSTITPLAISVTATGIPQVYNGTLDALVNLASSGVLAGDKVNFSDASASFANKNVGSNKTVTVSGISASGSDAGDYTLLNTTATTSASITPALLSYVVKPVTLKQGQGMNGLSGTVGGLVPGDTLASATTGSLTWVSNASRFPQPGKYWIAGGGLSAANYVFSQASGNAQGLIVAATATPPSPLATVLPQFLPGLSSVALVSANSPEEPAARPTALEERRIGNAVNHTYLRIIDDGVRHATEE